jgi:hypothetical protein
MSDCRGDLPYTKGAHARRLTGALAGGRCWRAVLGRAGLYVVAAPISGEHSCVTRTRTQ